MSETSQAKREASHPLKDRCWASYISAAGGIVSIAGAVDIARGNYKRGGILSAIGALGDFVDGPEARRFAHRQPKRASERANRGAIEDQAWDKLRNISLASALMLRPETSRNMRVVLGAVIAKEVITGVAGAKVIIDHRKENGNSWPAPIPSSPIGKETMWEIASGVVAGTAANAQPEGSLLRKSLDNTAIALAGLGIIRGVQTAPEYLQAQREMAALPPEEQTDYRPDFYRPHIGGQIIEQIERLTAATA